MGEGHLVCAEKLPNNRKPVTLKSEENIKKGIDFLVSSGVVAQNTIDQCSSHCEVFKESLAHYRFEDYLSKSTTLSDVQFLFSNGAATITNEQHTLSKLINHPDTKLVKYLIAEIEKMPPNARKYITEYDKTSFFVKMHYYEMTNCKANFYIAQHLQINSDIDWSNCHFTEFDTIMHQVIDAIPVIEPVLDALGWY